MKYACLLLAFALGFAAVDTQAEPDPHSYAEPAKVLVSALALDLAVDFERQELAGTAELTLDWRDPQAHSLVLDTRDLTIESIQSVAADGATEDLAYTLDKRDPIFGSALRIDTKTAVPNVRIRYRTSPQASGLQWMTPAQTASGKQPFMFSQSQAIHARSWVPLQDTPSVRFTYTAHIQAPKPLRVIMSADNDIAHPLDGDYRFVMKQPIPSYLLALSVGAMTSSCCRRAFRLAAWKIRA